MYLFRFALWRGDPQYKWLKQAIEDIFIKAQQSLRMKVRQLDNNWKICEKLFQERIDLIQDCIDGVN